MDDTLNFLDVSSSRPRLAGGCHCVIQMISKILKVLQHFNSACQWLVQVCPSPCRDSAVTAKSRHQDWKTWVGDFYILLKDLQKLTIFT